MSDTLARPPIVEAVLDIECDMPPKFDLAALEATARAAFVDRYPTLRKQVVQAHRIEASPDAAPKVSVLEHGLQGFQFFQPDEKQLVQVRAQGFSFNRLAPYSSLDDYLPEIERAWRLFVGLASPIQVRLIRLRYINRLLLPISDSSELGRYLRVVPQPPKDERLKFTGFVSQHVATEAGSGNQVAIVLASQQPEEGSLPVILDITVASPGPVEPPDWKPIQAKIQALRGLKNLVFESTLTEQCLKLFRA